MLKIEVETNEEGNLKCNMSGDKCTLNECAVAIDSIVSFVRKNDPQIEDEYFKKIFEVCLMKEEDKRK